MTKKKLTTEEEVMKDLISANNYPADYSHAMEEDDYSAYSFQQTADEHDEKHSMEMELQQGQNIAAIMQSSMPEYMIELGKLDVPPDEKVELDSLFTYGAANARPFTKYVNKTVTILGCCVHYHPPFQSYVSPEDARNGKISEQRAGYNKILFLLDEFDEEGLPIFMSGSEALANHARAMLANKGWFMWDEPVRYFITRGTTKGEPFTMINQDRVDRMRKEREERMKAKNASK